MSCCISSAVCCALVTASMSGIALGYNYSLAEYIDLKETNVSVYLKRGVFDDEIGDDMDWRRSGHQPVAGHIGESNLRTGAPEDETTPVRSGRRLDDSIYESDDRNRFEGSLMKLTAKPPASISSSESVTDVNDDEIVSKFSKGSLNQMKEIQNSINMRKFSDTWRKIGKDNFKTTENVIDERYLPRAPINPNEIAPGRRMFPMDNIGVYNTPGMSARYSVPAGDINDPAMWRSPKLPPEAFTSDIFGPYDEARPRYPPPITLRAGPVRPTRPKPTPRPKPTLSTASTPILERQEPSYPKSIDEEMDTFKDKLLLDKFDAPSFKEESIMKEMKGPRRNDEDYEEAAKGVPLRRKRESLDANTSNNFKIRQSSFQHSTTEKIESYVSEHRFFYKLFDPKRNTEIVTFVKKKSPIIIHDGNINTMSYISSSNIAKKLLETIT